MANEIKPAYLKGISLVTTGATVTTLAYLPSIKDHVYHVRAVIFATDDEHNEVASYERVATFQNDNGVLTLVGSVSTPHTAESTGGWDATLDADSTNIRVRVTGAAATNVRWKADVYAWATDYSGLVQG